MMRKLKYLNVCLDKNNINNIVSNYMINASICTEFENEKELFETLNNKKFNLLITNYNFEMLKKIRQKNENLQIFAVLNEPNKQNLLESLELKHVKFIQDLNCEESFQESLSECIKNIDSNKSNIVNLKDNFTYDNYNKTLFYRNDVVQLSKKEGLFLNLLLENENRALDYDEINENVWQGEMSQDALRSVVKELRKKTYKELVKNVSGVGYRLDSI